MPSTRASTAGDNTTATGVSMILNKTDFTITTDDDELRVDDLCRRLLRTFHQHLLQSGTPPAQAGRLAHSADYYLRDFLVSAQRADLFAETPGIVRRFAATWYIITTLEPAMGELGDHLQGVLALYGYLQEQGLLSPDYLHRIGEECAETAWYEERISSFWAITGDGYRDWLARCPLT